MKNVSVDQPERYRLDTDGTLTIKQVLPEDDKKLFFCRGMAPFHKEENITVLEIIKGKHFFNFFLNIHII